MCTIDFTKEHPVQWHENFEVIVNVLGADVSIPFKMENNIIVIGDDKWETNLRKIDIAWAWCRDVPIMLRKVAERMQNDPRFDTEHRESYSYRRCWCVGLHGIKVRRVRILSDYEIKVEYYWQDGPFVPEHDEEGYDGTKLHVKAHIPYRVAGATHRLYKWNKNEHLYEIDIHRHNDCTLYW